MRVDIIQHEFINYANGEKYKFVISRLPSSLTLSSYLKEFKKNGVKTIVKCCKTTLSEREVRKNRIRVKNLIFNDLPDSKTVSKWNKIVQQSFLNGDKALGICDISGTSQSCLLVVLGLIRFCGFEASQAVKVVKKKIPSMRFPKRYIPFVQRYESKVRGKCTLL